jgi:peptidyl-prolyl cis-trans isomerase D
MATLEKIRSKMGVLAAVFVGVSLLAFILGDFFDSRQSFMSRSKMNAGEVNGQAIRIDDYNNRVEETTNFFKSYYGMQNMDENMQDQLREQVWQQMVQDMVMADQFDEIGISVSDEELYELVTGPNPHPRAQEVFMNRETGVYDRSSAVQFLKALTAKQLKPEQEEIWLFMEREIHREKMLEKYSVLVNKSIYVTKLQSRSEYINSARKADARILSQRFISIPDSSVSFSNSDLKKYYRTHKNDFKQELSRDLDYITFDILPTEADYQAARKRIEELAPDFSTAESAKDFANANSDIPFIDKNFKKGELTGVADSFAFAAKLGDVYGPIFEDNTYKIFRLAEINVVPDSVQARHILIQPVANTAEALAAAQNLADSIKGLIEKGQDFAVLALAYSADNGSKVKGGDLGWFKEEGDMIDVFSAAAFSAPKNKVETVTSQYGIHVLQVTDRSPEVKKVKLATLALKVEPSKETYENIYEAASRFAATYNTSQAYEDGISKEGKVRRVAMNIRPGDSRISGLESPRELIRWAYTAEKGDVSGVIALNDKFIVARLTMARDDEFAPFDQVKTDLEARVRLEKKGEVLSKKLNDELAKNSSIDAVSAAIGAPVEEASGVSFVSTSTASFGYEPALIGAICGSEANKLSAPVVGNNGVYLFEVKAVTEPSVADDITLSMQKMRIQSMFGMRATYESYEALKTLVKVVDRRNEY